MGAFETASLVGLDGMTRIRPFLEENSSGLVVTDKGNLARYVQEVMGDIIMNAKKDGRMWTVEVKTEKRHTGNLFLEEWSNRNLNDLSKHAMVGSNRGWMDKLRTDVLLYYFMDMDYLYIINFLALKRWAFGYKDREPNLHRFRQLTQSKYNQLNDTVGRIVPINVLMSEMEPPPRRVTVKQLSMPFIEPNPFEEQLSLRVG